MMSDTAIFAQHLSSIGRVFADAAKLGGVVEIAAADVATLHTVVGLMERQFANFSQELEILRQTEEAHLARGMAEDLATIEAEALILDPEGKILRPKFGGDR